MFNFNPKDKKKQCRFRDDDDNVNDKNTHTIKQKPKTTQKLISAELKHIKSKAINKLIEFLL